MPVLLEMIIQLLHLQIQACGVKLGPINKEAKKTHAE